MNVLQKAQLTVASRGKDYGTPLVNHTRIAKIWSVILGVEVTPEQVMLCMIGTKMTRLVETPGHPDSILDIAGYAWCMDDALAEAAGQGDVARAAILSTPITGMTSGDVKDYGRDGC